MECRLEIPVPVHTAMVNITDIITVMDTITVADSKVEGTTAAVSTVGGMPAVMEVRAADIDNEKGASLPACWKKKPDALNRLRQCGGAQSL